MNEALKYARDMIQEGIFDPATLTCFEITTDPEDDPDADPEQP